MITVHYIYTNVWWHIIFIWCRYGQTQSNKGSKQEIIWLPNNVWSYLITKHFFRALELTKFSRGYCNCQYNIINPHAKYFIDQACSIKIAGCCLQSFLQVYGPQILLSLETRTKSSWPTSSHLDQKCSVNNPGIQYTKL